MKNTFSILAIAALLGMTVEGANLPDFDEEDDYMLDEEDEEWDLNAAGGRRLAAKTPFDADIWRNPFGDDLVPYYQGSCKLVSDDEWAGNVSLFQDLRYTEDGGYKPISISAAIRELDDESYCIGVFDSDPNTTSQHPNELMSFGRFMPNCENWIQAFGVYADYKHDDTDMMKLDGSYIGIRDTKTHNFVASCQFRVEAMNAEDFEKKKF